MKPLAPKTTLQNRYQISDLIGKGGMGEVYLAIDQRLGHSVALKRTTVGDDIMLAEAFEREARTLAQLRHNVLPKVSDHFLENDEQFLVMEYISGEDLSERLKATNKPFPLNWVLFWADQLLEALTYLHTHDPAIIHRDIKPQNLKLTAENNIVLLDFGLSKNALGQTRVTTTGSVVGYTPHYAPIEQIRGTGTNAKSDIFSLSATLYHLLSNASPPDALTRADSMLAGMPDPLRPLHEVNPEVSEAIWEAIRQGMEISQEKRFASARDMQKALRKAFNEIQNSMNAETVAFGGITESDLKTEVMNDLPMQTEEMPTPINANQPILENPLGTPQEFPHDVDYSSEKTEVFSSSDLQEANDEPNLDATVQFTGGMVEDSAEENVEATFNEVSNETEAVENFVTQDEIPAEVNDFQTNDDYSSADFQTSDDFSATDNFQSNDDFPVEQTAQNADATVPLITMDSGMIEDSAAEDTTNWNEGFDSEVIAIDETSEDQASSATAGFGLTDNFTGEKTEEFLANESAVDDFSQVNDFSQTEMNVEAVESVPVVQESTSQTPPPVKQKSSAGKYVAILGGLGVLLILLLGAGLGLGYLYSNGSLNFGGSAETDTNKTEQPKEEPKVETQPEITTTTDTNSESNTNSENTEIANTGNSNSDTTASTDTKTDNQSGKATTTTTTKTTDQPSKNTTAKTTTTTTSTTKQTGKTTNTGKKPPTDSGKKPPQPPPTETKKKKDAGVL